MTGAGATILLVDDEPDLLEALGRTLRAGGYRVRTARDGETALEEVAREPPDAVILDVIMPGLNGYQTCRRLKAREHPRELPVVLMSAKAEPADQYWASEVGAVCLLAKPLDPRRLMDRLADLLSASATP